MHDNSSDHGRQFIIPIILTVLTIILGFVSFETVFPDYPFSRKLYYTLQLFTLESGDRFYENGAQPLWTVITFNSARFLAVVTLVVTIVLAILSVLRRKYYMSKVRHMTDHTILCGLGGIGKAFAEKFPEKEKLIIIEKEASNENLSRLSKEGVRIMKANALDKIVLENVGIEHAKALMALTGDDFDNLSIINNVLRIISENQFDNCKISLSANIDSRNLKTAITEEWRAIREEPECELRKNLEILYETAKEIKSQGGLLDASTGLSDEYVTVKNKLINYNPAGIDFISSNGNIKLFNINQIAARYIFLTYPPDGFRSITDINNKAMNILILGYSKIGEELLKLFVRNCQYINRKNTKITLISLDADAAKMRIDSLYRNIPDIIDFNAYNENPHHLTGKFLIHKGLTTVDAIYICSGDDRYQASYSSRARELFGEKVPLVRPFYRNEAWNKNERQRNLYSFNILSQVSILDDIIKEDIDHKAIAVHHRWLKMAIPDYIKKLEKCFAENKDMPEPKPTMLPWHLLDEETRDDNRSVVEFINVKLRTVKQFPDKATYANPKKANIDFSFLDDKEKVEQLAEMEHRRWMANKYLYDWNYGKVRNTFMKEHESILPFELLDEGTKDYDRQQIMDIREIIELE
jgi:hypothetical protein